MHGGLTPAEHVYAQRLPERPSLQEEVGRKFTTKVGDIEDRRQPAVLLPVETSVVSQAEDRLYAEGGLVCLLYTIAEPHQR